MWARSKFRCKPSRYTKSMRQPVKLVGPGVTPDEVAAAFGISPERQAEIRELFRSYHERRLVKTEREANTPEEKLLRTDPLRESRPIE